MLRGRTQWGNVSAILMPLLLMFFLAGCAAQRGPVLYPNAHLKNVGDGQAQSDIEDCRRQAENYVRTQPGKETAKGAAGGAVGGAIVGGAVGAVTGHLGRGAAIGSVAGGTSGILRGASRDAKPSPVYKNFVDRCLREKGYEPIGWE